MTQCHFECDTLDNLKKVYIAIIYDENVHVFQNKKLLFKF